jgi:hypothetical protein
MTFSYVVVNYGDRQKPNVFLDFGHRSLHHPLFLEKSALQEGFDGVQPAKHSGQLLDDSLLDRSFLVAKDETSSPRRSQRGRDFRFNLTKRVFQSFQNALKDDIRHRGVPNNDGDSVHGHPAYRKRPCVCSSISSSRAGHRPLADANLSSTRL